MAAPSFGSAAHFPVSGTFPESLVVRDLDGDGRPDAVTANEGSGNVSVLKGDGAGAFGPPALFPSETPPSSSSSRIAAGDVDGDGDVDLAVTNTVNDALRPLVAVLRNDGAGAFADRTDLRAGRGPLGIALAQIVGGPALDIATANFNNNTVSVLTGDGAGGFLHGDDAITVAGVSTAPEALAVGDLDRDGAQDLVVTTRNAGPAVAVRRQSAPGVFDQTQRFGVGSIPAWVTAGDLDADGDLDVVVSSSNGTLSILQNDGTGTFAQSVVATGGGPNEPEQLVIRDLDGDGDVDLAAAHSEFSGVVAVYENDGAGGFAFQAPLLLPTERQPKGLAARDVNGDGRVDLVTANAGSGSISVLLGTGGRDPQCSDESDNDGDGRVDFPDDPDCDGARDDSELDPCARTGPASGAIAAVLRGARLPPAVAAALRNANCDAVLPLERALGLAPR